MTVVSLHGKTCNFQRDYLELEVYIWACLANGSSHSQFNHAKIICMYEKKLTKSLLARMSLDFLLVHYYVCMMKSVLFYCKKNVLITLLDLSL